MQENKLIFDHPRFLRPLGQECRIIWTQGPIDFKSKMSINSSLEHGDLILPRLGTGAYRSTSSFIVVNYNFVHEKQYVALKFTSDTNQQLAVVPIGDSSGYGFIPKCYSKYVQDPITFWHKALFDASKEFTMPCHLVPGYTGIFEIQLDARVHSPVLLQNNVLHPNCNIRWYGGQVQIQSPESPDIPYGRQWIKLDKNTPKIYLSDPLSILQVDPIMDILRQKNAKEMNALADIFENGNIDQGTSMSISTVPKEPGSESSSGFTSLTFLGFDMHANQVVGKQKGWFFDSSTQKSIDYDEILFFKQKVVTKKGPFGGIPLLVTNIRGEEWFISGIKNK